MTQSLRHHKPDRGQDAQAKAYAGFKRTEWLRWAYDSGLIASLKKSELPVLIALWRHANHQGQAWPSVKRIAAKTGRGVRVVQEALKSLVAHDRQFLTRMGQGYMNRATDTFVFGDFEPLSYQIDQHSDDFDAHQAHESAGDGCRFTRDRRTNLHPKSVKKVPREVIVEKGTAVAAAGNDDEIFADGLFSEAEAVQAMRGVGFCADDARRQIREFGQKAVINAVMNIEYMLKHKITVGGKPIGNPRAMVITHLTKGMPEHPAVIQARQKAEKAEQIKQKREQEAEQAAREQIKREQDQAMLEMFGQVEDREALRQQLVEHLREQGDPASLRTAQSYSRMKLEHPILQSALDAFAMRKK